MRLSRALNVDDLRRIARRRLPRVVWDYLEGGAEDGVTLRANREVFEAIRFAPRTLVDVSRRSQKATLFGRVYESPIGIAPMGSGDVPAMHGDKDAVAYRCGEQVMELLRNNTCPRDIATREAFENAITCVAASGGSTTSRWSCAQAR